MISISNSFLKVSIAEAGAEIRHIFHKQHQQEYMWSGDIAFWGRTSPVLFPIVGALKGDKYQFRGKEYHLQRHGFARDKVFKVTEQGEDHATFLLQDDEETMLAYPFTFKFYIIYSLASETLEVGYLIHNTGPEPMWFSVGGHPAFKVPLAKETQFQNYQLQFEMTETVKRYPVSKDGLIEKTAISFLEGSATIPLSHELFKHDALVFKDLRSKKLSLVSAATPRGLEFDYSGFPFLGIWSAPGADFVCIEPWAGIADAVESSQQIENKEGIRWLRPNEMCRFEWAVRIF